MLCVISRLCVRSLGALRQPRDDNARRSTERSTRRPRTVLLTDPFCLTLNRYPSRCPCRTRRSLPLHVRVRSSPQKVLKKCIDTGSRILVCLWLLQAAQAAPAPETPDPGAVPGFFTTADGRFALLSLTTGQGNSAFGALSLFVDTTGNFNTGV